MALPPLQLRMAMQGDLRGFAERTGLGFRRGAMRGAKRFQALAKLRFRQDTRSALGDRAANTWRDTTYPEGGKLSWHPSTVLWSKWPLVIRAHTYGATIVHKQGKLLAIPTDNVPIGRRSFGQAGFTGRRKARPEDVEDMFNQDLIFVRSRKNPNVTLAFVDAIQSRNRKGWRRPTPGRVKQRRKKKRILMFVLIKQTTLRPRLNWPRLQQDLGPVFANYLAAEIAKELAA